MKRRYAVCLALLLGALTGCGNDLWSSGDRVLVAKFLYDSKLQQPKRFDVVVFKYPVAPVEKGTPKNYIKRLLGLPGEIIAIFFGRLFHCLPPTEDDQDYSMEKWTAAYNTTGKDPLQLWHQLLTSEPIPSPGITNPQFKDDYALKLWQDRLHLKKNPYEIIRKHLDVALAVRRIVFDNEHQADDLKGILPPRWAAVGNSAWTTTDNDGKVFQHNGQGANLDWLRYRHIKRPADWPTKNGPDAKAEIKKIMGRTHKPHLITDFMGYNTNTSSPNVASHPPLSWVGDLMLECKLTVTTAQGEFRLELSKGIDRFQARWNLADGTCTLYRIHKGGKEEKLAEKSTRVKAAGDYQLRLANIDERLTVWVDRDLPFGDGHEYAAPAQYGPDDELDETKNNDLQPASIGSSGAAVQVGQIRLWRDTYYTRGRDPSPENGDWSDPSKWGPLRHLEVRTFYVYPGHYFCLGDNSPQSFDSRNWGLVPERLMLGRALLVYYPFDRAGRIK